jgi:hypothetical protein
LALGACLVLAAAFQVFFRYEYRAAGPVLYRLDRLSTHACEIAPYDRCHGAPPRAAATSGNPILDRYASPAP